ncbi:hypothetical protein GOP47_0022723 [Adiantum capillus-veneris]|uniref:Uncharacterized protein n=1 Tax=Adiantum capillus-veneris TaxID=13818 RepID=A0A9D4Z5L5_ADICA|nr:hypothetical protein GOP47_0022723 [Adiantum capillus-veneris]
MKEIITVQFGTYANFVGSHFWNLQDELLGLQNDPDADPCFANSGVNFDVLYRFGETTQGAATYTPRLLAIDARGSLGTANVKGSLYEQTPLVDITSVTSWHIGRRATAVVVVLELLLLYFTCASTKSLWKGQVSKHVTEPHVKNEFLKSLEQEQVEWVHQQKRKEQADFPAGSGKSDSICHAEHNIQKSLEESVQFWTDYSKVHFHPRSLYELEGVWHETTSLDDYGRGKGLLNGHVKEDVLNRLRFFVEEADHMQGFKVLVDDSGGFAAVATEFLEAVVDEYNKTPTLLFTLRPPSSVKKSRTLQASVVRDLHDAISFSELSKFSSCSIPLGLSSFAGMSKYLAVDDSKHFHTSAVYAAAVSCITLPLRIELSSGDPSNAVCTGAMDMESLVQVLLGRMGRRVPLMHLAMPALHIPGREKHEAVDFSRFQPLLPGVIETDDQLASYVVVVQGSSSQDPTAPPLPQDIVNFYTRKRTPFYRVSASLCPLAVPLPFPDIFTPLVASEVQPTKCKSDISSIPIATKLCTSVAILPYLEKRLRNLQHPSGGSLGWQILERWNRQKDEVRELSEIIANSAAAYGSTTRELASDSE